MPKYFMQDTPLGEYERLMTQTPYPRGPDEADNNETAEKQASTRQGQPERRSALAPCGEYKE